MTTKMNLIESHPDIAKQWHPTKNGDLKPNNCTYSSHKKVWWICENTNCSEKCIHEYEMLISNKTRKMCGCPYCSLPLKKICAHRSIVFTHPNISKQWHPTKNGDLKPEHFSYGSKVKIWWLCDKTCNEGCKHEWESTFDNRITKNNNCPFCSSRFVCIHNSIVYRYPELVKQWHPIKNGKLKPEECSFGSGKKIWWLCEKTCIEGCKHEWNTDVRHRTLHNGGCPHCSFNNVKPCIHDSIVYTHPELIKQVHPTKNDNLKPENYRQGSSIKIWWICNKNNNHYWITSIAHRTIGSGCPYCINKTEEKLYDTLIIHYTKLKQQFKVEWCKHKTYLPYDFVLENNKIIIELDGIQHFEQVSNWLSPEKTHLNDKYKMKCANVNGFSVIRLLQTDVFYDTYNWLEELKTNIEKIKTDKIIQNIYMCKDNEYDIFNNLETSLD